MIVRTAVLTQSLVLALLYGAAAQAQPHTIGVYFDRDGLVNCRCIATDHSNSTTAYIIAKNLTATIEEWCGRLELSPGAYVTSTSLPAGARNSAQFPDLHVHLRQGVGGTGPHVLAEIAITWTGQLEIRLEPLADGPAREAAAPVFGSGGRQTEFAYEYGDGLRPVAVVADRAICPSPNVVARPLPEKTQPERIEARPGGYWNIHADGPSRLVWGAEIFADRNLNMAFRDFVSMPMCFVGTLVEFTLEGLKFGTSGPDGGFARAKFNVVEMFWGGSRSDYEVYIEGIDVPGVIKYTIYRTIPIDASTVGKQYLIAPNAWLGHLFINMPDFCYLLEEIREGPLQNLLMEIRETARLFSLERQFRDADIVVEGVVTARNQKTFWLDTTRLLKGPVPEPRLEIVDSMYPGQYLTALDEFLGRALPLASIEPGDRCLVIGVLKDGRLHTLRSGRSVYLVTRDGYRLADGSHRPIVLAP